jgi:hypothetical protein
MGAVLVNVEGERRGEKKHVGRIVLTQAGRPRGNQIGDL